MVIVYMPLLVNIGWLTAKVVPCFYGIFCCVANVYRCCRYNLWFW